MDGTLRGSFRVGVPSSATVRAAPDTDVLYWCQLWVDDVDYGVAHTTDPYTNGFDGHIQAAVGVSFAQTDYPELTDFASGGTITVHDWMIGTTRGGNDIWELTDGADLAEARADTDGFSYFMPPPDATLGFSSGVATATLPDWTIPTPVPPQVGIIRWSLFAVLVSPDLGPLPDHDIYYRVGFESSPSGGAAGTVSVGGPGLTNTADNDFFVDADSALASPGDHLRVTATETSDVGHADSGIVIARATDYTVDVLLHREYPLRGRFANSFRAA